MAKNNENNYFDESDLQNKNQKRRNRSVSKRSGNRRNVEINNGFEIPLNDDFLIVDKEDNQQFNQNKTVKKNQPIKRNAKTKRRVKQKKRHPVLSAILSIILVLIITGCLVVGSAVFYFLCIMSPSDEIQDPSNNLYNLKLQYTSILYAKDSKGNDVELKRLHGDQNRLWVDNKDIPKCLKNAFISCEDKRFREHSGVDWKRTSSAALNLVFHFYNSEQGGSTITQQLIKNITGNNQKTSTRKIQEIKDALYVEDNYDKDTILECYLNTIHLGNGVDGVEVASNYYFDKNTSELNIVESACLAAITNNPSDNEPYKHPDTNKTRRNWVIDEMYNNGYITKSQCEKAKNSKLKLRKNPSTTLSTTNTVEEEYNSYFVDAVIEDVIEKLVKEKGYTKEYATEQLYKGGYKIYTTVDLNMQKKLEKVYKNDAYFS
ncbi:MAG: penicillin-binding protein, partial [Clostridia bacterium]|nr:penicillin-binding protein [Clostridia bacterium]